MTTGDHRGTQREGVGRLTTPTMAAPDPAVRARTAIGTALGIVSPTAVPLRDGRVWLTSRHDVLPRPHRPARLEAQLSRRAADRASDDRHARRSRRPCWARRSPAPGASPPRPAPPTPSIGCCTSPGLDQSRRAEGEAMLRLALRLAAQELRGSGRTAGAPAGHGDQSRPWPPRSSRPRSRSAATPTCSARPPPAAPTRRTAPPRTGRCAAIAAADRQTLTREVRGTGL